MGRSFESVLGTLHVERAYYYCPTCQSGVYPRDRALSLEDLLFVPWRSAHGGQRRYPGQLRREQHVAWANEPE
jgi:hypothetical protein